MAKNKELPSRYTTEAKAWGIIDPKGKICKAFIRTHRKTCIYTMQYFLNTTWKQLYRQGYRAVRVYIEADYYK